MANKKTKKELFVEVLEKVKGNEELTNFITHELELIEKKAQARKNVVTAKQKENEKISEEIYSNLVEAGVALTIKELQDKLDNKTLSNQKISALLAKMVDEGKVERIKEKKITKYLVK